MRLTLILASVLALSACGADGPPVSPGQAETPVLQFGATVQLSEIGQN